MKKSMLVNNKISIYNFLKKCLTIITMICAFTIFIYNFVFTAHVYYSKFESAYFDITAFTNNLLLIIVFAIIFAFSRLNKSNYNINVYKLFAALSAIYIIVGLYIIFNTDPVIRADAQLVYDSTIEFLNGDYSNFEHGKYISVYPNQLGIMLLDCLLIKFGKNVSFNFIFNLLCVLLINFINLKITDFLFKNKKVNIISVIISFAFLPQLFFIMFAYGLIPGFLCLITAFYFTLKYCEQYKIKHILLVLIFVSLACLLKQNFMIGGISIAIYLLLNLFKKRDIKITHFASIILVLLCLIVPTKALNYYVSNKTQCNLQNGMPSILWVAMGTDMQHKDWFGWYSDYNYSTFKECDFNPQLATDAGKEKIKDSIQKIKDEPVSGVEFFLYKNISQWTDPLYESLWSGPLEDCKQYTHTDFLKSLYNGGTVEQIVNYYCKAVTLTIWLFSFAYILYKNKDFGWELFFTYFIGGFLFHTIWEAKSQYIYTYVFSLIPFCSFAISKTMDKIKSRRIKNEC